MLRTNRANTEGSTGNVLSPGRQKQRIGSPLASPKSSPRLRASAPASSGARMPGAEDRLRATRRSGGEAEEPVKAAVAATSAPVEVTVASLANTIQQLATLEATLWNILEGIKSRATYVSFFCREYWGTSASRAQLSLDRLSWNERLKKQVSQACILESLSLAVVSQLCSGTMQDVSVAVRSRLTNLLYYIHENCLVLVDLMRQRLQYRSQQGSSAESQEAERISNLLNFDILVRVNRYRALRKGEHVLALKQHNEMITNILRQLCRVQGAAAKQGPVSRGGRGDLSPGAPRSSRVTKSATGAQSGGVIRSVNEILASATPLERLRPRTIHTNMLQFTHFEPLLNVDGRDRDCPWPEKDPYDRFGTERFASEGPIIWFEPLPPMMADLDRIPSLPPPPSNDTYTLVLDLDETLVHYFELDGLGNYGIRPGMVEFLARMHTVGYELVIFTAATQDYADWVIGQIDPDGLIHHRLYRQNALPWGPLFAKDLSRLGRDLDRMLIIDNVQENFMLHPNNGIFISTWYDDPQDTALTELTPLLEEIITTRGRVSDILEKYREQIPVWAGFGRVWESSDAFLDADQSYDGPDGAAEPDEEAGAFAPQDLGHGLDATQAQPAKAFEAVPEQQGQTTFHQHRPQQHMQIQAQVQPHPQQIAAPRAALPSAAGAQQPYRQALPQQRPTYTAMGIAGPLQAAPPQQQQEAWTSVSSSAISGPYQSLLRTGLAYNPYSRQR